MKKKKAPVVPIDHAKVMDGFGDLEGHRAYADERLRCGLCGEKFVFTAAAKKYVFEVRGVPVKMGRRGAAYCDACRDRRAAFNRLVRASECLQRDHRASVAALRADPDDARAHVACARSVVRLVAGSGRGALDGAVHHARRALMLDPTCVEALYWEARAHELALRPQKARALLEAFVVHHDEPARASLLTDARRRLALPDGELASDPNVPDVRRLVEIKTQLKTARSWVIRGTRGDLDMR